MKWITRVPATISAAQSILTQADPHAMRPLTEGYRDHVVTSTYGGVEQRWVLLYSAARTPQATRPVGKHLLKQSTQEVQAFTKLCDHALAGEVDARQALARFAPGLKATCLHDSAVWPTPRYGKRGRPGQGAQPAQVGDHITGALASRVATRQALVEQQSGFLLATNELDETQRSPQELLAGYQGPVQAERGFRFRKDPPFLASTLYLKKLERIMALRMVMTGCLLV